MVGSPVCVTHKNSQTVVGQFILQRMHSDILTSEKMFHAHNLQEVFPRLYPNGVFRVDPAAPLNVITGWSKVSGLPSSLTIPYSTLNSTSLMAVKIIGCKSRKQLINLKLNNLFPLLQVCWTLKLLSRRSLQ